MAQTGDSTKPTRFRGPTVVTLRGAGSLGHEAQTVGAGADVGLDIQIPVSQTANAFQITKPDGTVIYAIGPNGAAKVPQTLTAPGAIPVRPSADYIITNAAATALTLAAPTAGADDGIVITVTSATGFAHTITATGLFQSGTAASSIATFAAFAGASVTLKAFNGKWVVQAVNAVTFT